jgi:hypothetical protein
MFALKHALSSFCLVAASAPALMAQTENLSLGYDTATRVVTVQANCDAVVLLLTGTRLDAPMPIMGVDLWVWPVSVIPFGAMSTGDTIQFPVPRQVLGATMQLLGIETQKFTAVASAPVLIDHKDIIERTFSARLAGTPGGYQLLVGMTVPSSGYELRLDGWDTSDHVTRVYVRLVTPGRAEVVVPALHALETAAKLTGDIGVKVEVHMAREQRGEVVMPVYELMTELDVHPGIG